ncbi:MAG: DUF1275 domain-containing protein [Myxococcales bacterium]|nr:DUF1275 domain-containing protein [Myxococcales bacterium]
MPLRTAVLPVPIFTTRALGAWALLAGASGFTNGAALVACGRMVTHVTGIATRIGNGVGQSTLLFEYSLVFVSFLLGGYFASTTVIRAARVGSRSPYRFLFLVEMAVLAVLALAGALGFFSAFGATFDTPADYALLSALAFSSGLQNATVGIATQSAVRTTHMTGPATDLAIQLGCLTAGTPETRPEAWRQVRLRLVKIVGFILGGALAPFFAHRMGFLVFLLPIAPLYLGAHFGFARATVQRDASARQFTT